MVILAAGRGTRMYSDTPKVLHQIAGKSMLAHVITTATKLNPQGVYVVVGHGKQMVRATVDANVQWVEQNEQLGTGHAVKMALPYLPKIGKTLILYGDVPLIDEETLQQLLQAASDNEVAVLTDILDDATGYGRIKRDEEGNVCAIVEEKDADNAEKAIREINTGILLLPNVYLSDWLNALSNRNAQQEYYLTDVIDLAVKNNIKIHTVAVRAHHLAAGVNNLVQLAQLERVFQQMQAEKLMREGLTLRDAQRFDLRGCLKMGRDCVVDINVLMEGDCILGNRVQIGANCVLKNVQIGDGCVIRPFSHLENCVVGKDAQIGPFSRLRPDAQLEDEVHIGNFVEVKKSTLKKGSKVNHLSYIGDATVGEQSNIGAGTITCNYDGVNKYQTIVGKDVRIGSGTMLVAPVEVGDKATTGAGSVITKYCPPNQLTVGRARQATIEGWERPEKEQK